MRISDWSSDVYSSDLRRMRFMAATLVALVGVAHSSAAVGEVTSPPVLKVPDGFSIELVAGSPLIERPIVAAFDDDGRLYVSERSEERRVGSECVRTCRSRWSRYQ